MSAEPWPAGWLGMPAPGDLRPVRAVDTRAVVGVELVEAGYWNVDRTEYVASWGVWLKLAGGGENWWCNVLTLENGETLCRLVAGYVNDARRLAEPEPEPEPEPAGEPPGWWPWLPLFVAPLAPIIFAVVCR